MRSITHAPVRFMVVASLLLAPSALAEGVRLTRKPAADGATVVRKATTESSLDLEMQMGEQKQSMKQGTSQNKEIKIEVLESDASGPTRIAYTTVAETVTQESPVGEQSMEGELVGETFHVSRDGTGFKIAYDDNSDVDEDTAARVQQEMQSLGGDGLLDLSMGFAEILAERDLEVGKVVEVDAEQARKMFPEATEVKSMTLKLTGEEEAGGNKLALFDLAVAMVAVEEDGPMSMRIEMDLKGKVALLADGAWLHRMEIAGPISLRTSEEAPVNVSGKGQIKTTATANYPQERG